MSIGPTYVNQCYRECRSFEDSYRDPRILEACRPLLNEIRPDVAHVQHLTHLSTEIISEIESRYVPVLFTLHDFWLQCQRGQRLDLDLKRCPGATPAGCARCLGLSAASTPAAYGVRRLLGPHIDRLPTSIARAARTAARFGLSEESSAGTARAAARLAHVREISRHVWRFLAPSQTMRDSFVEFGFEPGRILSHPYGHDHEPFRGLERAPSKRLRIGFIGSLMVSKGPDVLLRAFAGLPAGSASLDLYGALSPYHGDDSYRATLEPLLAQEGVRYRGQRPSAEVPAALAELDVLVVPSIWLENAPLTISEAYMAGVPVIASDLGGMAEMVEHEISGLRFPVGDADALERALRRLIDEPELLPRLRHGLPRVRDIADDAEHVRALYEEALRERRDPPHAAPRLAAIMVNYRTPELTLKSAQAVLESSRDVASLLIVDSGSGDGSAEQLEEALPEAVVLRSERNLGFSGASNLGLRRALDDGADLVVLINSDVAITPDCLERLEAALDTDSRAGIAGPALICAADGVVESLGISLDRRTGRMRQLGFGSPSAGGFTDTRRVDAVSGCVVLLRRAVLDKVGLLDEDYFYSFEDVDWCLRASRAGFASICVAAARAHHIGGASIGSDSSARSYYAARNHLLLSRRTLRGGRVASLFRATLISVLNLAHAALRSEGARGAALGSAVRGIFDHLRQRYGAAPE